MKSARYVDKNSKKGNPFQNERTMDHKQLKLTATTSITCFSDQANTLTRDLNEVLAELTNKNPFTLPPSLRELEGTTHIIQFHFNTMVTSRRPDFILDKVFDHPVLALPPPAPIQVPEPYVIHEGHHTSPKAEATLTNTSLGNLDVPEPPKPHTPPATISQPTIIETSIMTYEHEPIIKEGKCIIYPTNVHGVPMEPGYMKIQVDTVYPGWEGLKVWNDKKPRTMRHIDQLVENSMSQFYSIHFSQD
nr:nucleic acid-binding, OB-fold protein [Tanacetum cinerariifolium]